MNAGLFSWIARGRTFGAVLLVSLLAACSSTPDGPKPTELGPNSALLGVRLAWSARIGEVTFPIDVKVTGNTVTVAG